MNVLKVCVLAVACLCLISGAGCADEYRTVVDSRGVQVQVPMEIERVVTLDDGFAEGIMTLLGEADNVVGLGNSGFKSASSFSFEAEDGQTYNYSGGMNPVSYLNPSYSELPVVAGYGVGINFETLASLDPDVVILRLGSCFTWASIDKLADKEETNRMFQTIESLGIPLVVLYGPPVFGEPTIDGINDEIRIVGQVFGKEDPAMEVARYLETVLEMIQDRTAGVSDEDKPRVLIFGLAYKARDEGGAGTAHGIDTIESYFLEEIVNAKNAFDGMGSFTILSAEHVIASNPDVIILPTAWGYHSPIELYEAPYYQNLKELDAVKNRRVVALPFTPANCAKRLEYPIEVMIMAKACYPDLFEDIKVHEWVLEFYQNVYGVDEDTAIGLRSAQWLDWTVEEDF